MQMCRPDVRQTELNFRRFFYLQRPFFWQFNTVIEAITYQVGQRSIMRSIRLLSSSVELPTSVILPACRVFPPDHAPAGDSD